jgi:NAD(P)-dependent dehydrogenase (short-subunit alcohol dehydrogenase family)
MARRITSDEDGFVSVQYIVAAAFSLLFLVLMTNIVVVQYARGVVRTAADEGVRAGARVVDDPQQHCEDRARSALEAGGEMTAGAVVTCTVTSEQIEATADATFEPWLPLMPRITEHTVSVSTKESA